MKLYLLVGRTGNIYGMVPFEELARQFKASHPGRTVGMIEVTELDGDVFPEYKVEGIIPGQSGTTPTSMVPHPPKQLKKHVFVEGECLYCPCKQGDPAGSEACEKAPPGAPDFE